jgi:hypothetical protein
MGLAHNSMQAHARKDLSFDVFLPGGLGVIMVAETIMGNHMEIPAEGRKKHVESRIYWRCSAVVVVPRCL